jgi:hypothetical protein
MYMDVHGCSYCVDSGVLWVCGVCSLGLSLSIYLITSDLEINLEIMGAGHVLILHTYMTTSMLCRETGC